MSVIYVHIIWFTCFFILFLLTSIMTVILTYFGTHFIVTFDIFSIWNFPHEVAFSFDWISVLFISIVLLISSIIIVYSYNYIAPYSKSYLFLWLTTLFVVSMLLVISISNLLFCILGWDGLGLISFFLIVYYQNQSSVVSGLFTLLINRVGDCFFLITLSLMFHTTSSFYSFSSDIINFLTVSLIILTFITNSAIYPFSPWLPIAISAPTPISALVHSSTLVTAGLYLIMRFSYYMYSCPILINILLIASIFTSFYAGVNTMFENDLNNIIALSTLSHLGFICISFSCGLVYLSFFHLLVHALFNSLLFMSIGDIIINLNHSQDIRYLSSGFTYTPLSCFIMNVSILNLIGIPSLSGFFSNDLILELLNYSSSSVFVVFVIYLNVFFTFYYTYQFFFYSFQSSNVNPYQLFHSIGVLHSSILLVLSVFTFNFSYIFFNFIYFSISFIPLILSFNLIPLVLNCLFFLGFYSLLRSPTINTNLTTSFFSSMIFLHFIAISVSSGVFFSLGNVYTKTTESGLYNYSLNVIPKFLLSHSSGVVVNSLYFIQYNFISLSILFLFLYLLLQTI